MQGVNIPLEQLENLEKQYGVNLHVKSTPYDNYYYLVPANETFRDGHAIYIGMSIKAVERWLKFNYGKNTDI